MRALAPFIHELSASNHFHTYAEVQEIILIKFVSNFIVCTVLHFEAQNVLRLRFPLIFFVATENEKC